MNTHLYITVCYNRMVTGVYTELAAAIAANPNPDGSFTVYKINANIQHDCIFDIDKHGIEHDLSVVEVYHKS